MNKQALREFAITVLDDENGINESAYQKLSEALRHNGCEDIDNMVKTAEGRYYLPEDHGLTA